MRRLFWWMACLLPEAEKPKATMIASIELTHLEHIVRKAGSIALDYFTTSVKAWEKSPGHPVSEADLAVNRFLYQALMANDAHGWLSEESEDDPGRLSRQSLWIVDPIDGTRAFLRGETYFAVSVALVKNGRPVLGAIYRPTTGDMYLAEKGKGAWLNGAFLTVSTEKSLTHSRMLADPNFLKATKQWPHPWPDMTYIQIPAISLRLTTLAEAGADGMVSIRPKSDWDLAAGDLILQEAGGICVDDKGAVPIYNRPDPSQPVIIATTPALQGPIMKRVIPAMQKYRARLL